MFYIEPISLCFKMELNLLEGGNELKCTLEKFECFDVYNYRDTYSFCYVNIHDTTLFYDGLFDYILSEDNLLNFAKLHSESTFEPSKRNYMRLFNNLKTFLDEEYDRVIAKSEDEETIRLLKEEEMLISDNGELFIRLDKIGKFGEYIFHILLTKRFQLDCIIPKFRLATDRNMNVFGIDTLFLNVDEKVLFFGESKVSASLEGGIKLINKSLKSYEQEIENELLFIFNRDEFAKSVSFHKAFEDKNELCFTFKEFINEVNIEKIGIPIFIAHGTALTPINPENIIDTLSKDVVKKDFFGLKAIYYLISFPIINKKIFVEKLIAKIMRKRDEYERKARSS